MPQIEVTVRCDDGRSKTLTFALADDLNDLDAIDEAVEAFKNAALPQVEQALLAQNQERVIEHAQKNE